MLRQENAEEDRSEAWRSPSGDHAAPDRGDHRQRCRIYSETIQAISGLLVTNPHLVERGGKLFDEFDEISLGETRRLARALTLGLPASHVMRVMLALRLHQEQQGDMLV
jgi:hypothetical protein